jgi:hypothetical protein
MLHASASDDKNAKHRSAVNYQQSRSYLDHRLILLVSIEFFLSSLGSVSTAKTHALSSPGRSLFPWRSKLVGHHE